MRLSSSSPVDNYSREWSECHPLPPRSQLPPKDVERRRRRRRREEKMETS
jgi:hypothetical protein